MQLVNELDYRIDYAEGSVDPELRVESGEINQDTIDQIESKIMNDEFVQMVDSRSAACRCMDCRRTSNGDSVIGVKAAGGSLTAVVADALTLGKFRKDKENAAKHTKTVLGVIKAQGLQIGGHTATNVASTEMCGCGAADKLDNPNPTREHPSILDFFIRSFEGVFNDLGELNRKANLGLDISERLIANTKHNAQKLRDEGYAANGKVLSEAIKEVAGPENMIELSGPQKAVLAVLMLTPGEVLDTAKIHHKYGDDYQVFEMSGWGIANQIKALSVDAQDFNDMFVAALAYNLSAAGVIGGPGLKIIVKS